jgi:hypothetical protein
VHPYSWELSNGVPRSHGKRHRGLGDLNVTIKTNKETTFLDRYTFIPMVIPHWEEYLCEVLEANFTSCTNRIAQFGFNLDLDSLWKVGLYQQFGG